MFGSGKKLHRILPVKVDAMRLILASTMSRSDDNVLRVQTSPRSLSINIQSPCSRGMIIGSAGDGGLRPDVQLHRFSLRWSNTQSNLQRRLLYV